MEASVSLAALFSQTLTTVGFPTVSVPVLSKSTAVIWPAFSKATPSRIKIPRSAAAFDPAIIATGVARPMAQGQAIIRTAAAIITPDATGPDGRCAAHKNRPNQLWTCSADPY